MDAVTVEGIRDGVEDPPEFILVEYVWHDTEGSAAFDVGVDGDEFLSDFGDGLFPDDVAAVEDDVFGVADEPGGSRGVAGTFGIVEVFVLEDGFRGDVVADELDVVEGDVADIAAGIGVDEAAGGDGGADFGEE